VRRSIAILVIEAGLEPAAVETPESDAAVVDLDAQAGLFAIWLFAER
jgi:hypothetical protein